MYCYNINNFLKINSDVANLIPEAFLSDGQNNNSTADVIVEVSKNTNNYKQMLSMAPGLYFSNEQNMIANSFNLAGLTFSSSLIFEKNVTIYRVSPSYLFLTRELIKNPLASMFPFEHMVKLIIEYALLKKDKTFFIAAGLVNDKNKTLLISSMGGMGKTTLFDKLIGKNGFTYYLGDDTVITDGDFIYSYPKEIRVRKIGTPFFSYNSYLKMSEKYKGYKNITKALPDKVIFLERADNNQSRKLDCEQTARMAYAISSKILPLSYERSFLAAHYSGLINLIELEKKRKDLTEKLVQNSSNYAVSSNHVVKIIGLTNETK